MEESLDLSFDRLLMMMMSGSQQLTRNHLISFLGCNIKPHCVRVLRYLFRFLALRHSFHATYEYLPIVSNSSPGFAEILLVASVISSFLLLVQNHFSQQSRRCRWLIYPYSTTPRIGSCFYYDRHYCVIVFIAIANAEFDVLSNVYWTLHHCNS